MLDGFIGSSQAGRKARTFMVCVLALAASAAPSRAQSPQDPIYVFHTNLGNISVQLFPDVAPKTVANFLRYVNRGYYANSLIHRSVPGFVVQGGGYQVQSSSINTIPTDPPVVNEFHLSNLRGTIAMAKNDGDPNSATSEWFFNESDSNAANLDNQNGGFTVFGRVADSASLAVMDKLAAVPVPSPSPFSAPLNEMPVINYHSGQAVTVSQLLVVSAITPAWTAASVTVGEDGQERLLWNRSDGGSLVWSLNAGGGRTGVSALLGPYSGWTARAVAQGTDGLTRVLWNNTDGAASFWNLNSATGGFTQHSFGPYSGWTASALSAAAGSVTHILWTNAGGQITLWNYRASDGGFTQRAFGPYAGWTAKYVADGPDGLTRLLWNHTDGRMSLWSLNSATGSLTQHTVGPYAGWTASGVTVGPDNTTHILWTSATGQASFWNYHTADGSFTQRSFGPYPGWNAKSVADGPDGLTRVLWTHTNGQVSLWNLNSAAGGFTQTAYAPPP